MVILQQVLYVLLYLNCVGHVIIIIISSSSSIITLLHQEEKYTILTITRCLQFTCCRSELNTGPTKCCAATF